MSKLHALSLLFWILSIADGSDIHEFEKFIEEIIEAWKLQSPTLIVQGDLPQLCMTLEWVLCLPATSDTNNEQLGPSFSKF